jgi:hypothetical protein
VNGEYETNTAASNCRVMLVTRNRATSCSPSHASIGSSTAYEDNFTLLFSYGRHRDGVKADLKKEKDSFFWLTLELVV